MAEDDQKGAGEWSIRALPLVNHQSSTSAPDLRPAEASVSPSTKCFGMSLRPGHLGLPL